MQDLMIRNDVDFEVSVTLDAETLKADALESSALIFRVRNAVEHGKAVEAQTKLLGLIRGVEKTRKKLKEPVLELARQIDNKAGQFIQQLEEEGMRIGALVNEFQELERAKQVAEAQLLTDSLNRLERERAEKVSLAESVGEQDKINEEYSRKVQEATAVTPAPVRAKGQMVKSDWDITISDINLLYRAHPTCVDLKPRVSEIKALLDAGVDVKGVTAKKAVKATVRTSKPKDV